LVLVVGDHDPFCGDLELLLAIYGRDWEALVGARPPLWQPDRKAAGCLGIGKGERPYTTRFSAVAAIGGSRPWYAPNGTQWLVLDNPTAASGCPTASCQPITASSPGRLEMGWSPSARPLSKGGTEPVHRPA
jgi:hypothetical protein